VATLANRVPGGCHKAGIYTWRMPKAVSVMISSSGFCCKSTSRSASHAGGGDAAFSQQLHSHVSGKYWSNTTVLSLLMVFGPATAS
jgi:hypothetical protein